MIDRVHLYVASVINLVLSCFIQFYTLNESESLFLRATDKMIALCVYVCMYVYMRELKSIRLVELTTSLKRKLKRLEMFCCRDKIYICVKLRY